MTRHSMRLIALAFLMLIVVPAGAHDSWINNGSYKNPGGEWCCGEGDCGVVLDAEHAITVTAQGYRLRGSVMIRWADGSNVSEYIDEAIPFAEVLPSPDGQFWRCRRPDGTRRCFFAPRPSS